MWLVEDDGAAFSVEATAAALYVEKGLEVVFTDLRSDEQGLLRRTCRGAELDL